MPAPPVGGTPSRMRAFLDAQQKKKGAEAPLTRFALVALFLFTLFSIVGVRLFWVMVLHPHIVKRPILKSASFVSAARADILDRNGAILATNLSTFSLYAKPSQISDPRLIAEKLNHIIPNTTAPQLYKKLTSSKNFVWIKRNLTPKQRLSVQYLGDRKSVV